MLATQADIKKNYIDLAKKYHPDKNPDDPSSEQKFKEIVEAYEVLSNVEKRKRYNTELKYYIQRPTTQYHFSEEQNVQYNTKTSDPIKKVVIMFLVVVLIAIITISIEYSFIQNLKKKSLEPGMTTEEVFNIYGSPTEMNDEYLCYDSSKIFFLDNQVTYWYNAYDKLSVKNVDVENISDIIIGEPIQNIFHDYGYPDTYAKTFIAYGDTIIYYQNNNVTSVETIQ